MEIIFKNHLNKKVMKTTAVNNSTVTNKAGNTKADNTNPASQNPNNGISPSKTFDSDKKDEPKKEEVKKEEPKTEAPAPQKEQPKAEEAKPQAEPTKKELKEQLMEQHARKLEDTVKMVEALGKKIAQKNKLQNTIANIDGFTVTQNDEKDDMASDSKFQRCELVISDDDGNEFTTKNPFIIAYVAHEVRQLCVDKLAEVEASIVLPL
jgi:chemotaxis protein histidine kinase CheA